MGRPDVDRKPPTEPSPDGRPGEEPAPNGRVVVAGGTGFLGRCLGRALVRSGYEVIALGRHEPARPVAGTFVRWDGRTLGSWVDTLEGAVAVVNLAGRSVDCRKSPEHQDEILRSRVDATRVLGEALERTAEPPSVWVQMSTAHRYGDPPEVVCDEDSSFGWGFAPFVGQAWEDAFHESLLPGVRRVVFRTSLVLGREGGALPILARLVRWGLGGAIGHGRQGISWIHERDLMRLFLQAITDPTVQGSYLATAPNPVSNRAFMRELRRVLRRPVGLPAATWMVRIGAPLIGTDAEIALYGRYCVSRRLAEGGFEFEFPELREALRDLFRRPPGKSKSADPARALSTAG